MKKIEAIIERTSDGGYSVYMKDQMFSGQGRTSEEARKDMIEAMDFYKETALSDGWSYPRWMDGEFEIVYKFDTQSLLEYYSGILSLSGLEKVTGVHQKQLWSYLHGNTKPRREQVEKIEKGLHGLGLELQSVSL